MLALSLAIPDEISHSLTSITQWSTHYLGWLILLIVFGFVVLCIILAFGRTGNLRLGGEDEKPQFSFLSWSAMLFAAGMGSGLVFYGAAEPLTHFMAPPPAAVDIAAGAEQARRALSLTFFHWGIHAWAIYAIAGLCVAYFTFRKHTALLPSAPIKAHVSKRWWGVTRHSIDMLAAIAVVFGLVATLSKGTFQLADGVERYFTLGAEPLMLQLVILFIMFLAYMLSASTGLYKGIKWLSNINMLIAISLMLFVIAVGPTLFILESFVSGIGDYLDRFMKMSFNVRQYSDEEGWTEGWTMMYLLWWVAWAPFVGVFIARISRGRTVREFLIGVLAIPTVFSMLWFSALGGSALYLEMIAQPGFGAQYADIQGVTFALFDAFPLQEVTGLLLIFLLFIFLVTSADSGTLVLGMFTSEGSLEPSASQRLFWGAIIALVTAGALIAERGIGFLNAFAVFGGLPYLGVMVWQCYALCKATRQEKFAAR